MFGSSVLSWTFTIVFLVTGGYSFVRLVGLLSGPERDGDRLAELFHLVMSLAMIAMAWAWTGGPASPSGILQTVVFGVLTLAFLIRAYTRPSGHGRLTNGYHTVMAAAMTWMVVAMPLMMSMPMGGSGSAGGHAGHSGHSGADPMADMPGMTGPAAGPSVWVLVVCGAFVLALLAAAALWATRAVRGSAHHGAPVDTAPEVAVPAGAGSVLLAVPRAAVRGACPPRVDAGCHLLMSLGMAGMLLAML